MATAASSKKAAPRGKAFPKGKSGNPTGRPKRTEEEVSLIEACKAKTNDALTVIEALMRGADKDSVKLSAAQYIIDRGWGRPVQQTELMGKDGSAFEITHKVINVVGL